MIWLKAAIGIGVLWYLTQKTQAGAAVVAAVRTCPPGTQVGPWFTCVPQCPPGWTHGQRPDGTGYCYGGGTISFAGGDGSDTSTPVSNSLVSDIEGLLHQINPFTGLPIGNGTAATGVDGNTISVNPDKQISSSSDPITDPNDPRLLDGNGINGIQL